MGLLNWLLKNGPGSPGSTATAFVKLYESADVQNHDEEWRGVFFMIFMSRYQAHQRMGFVGGNLLNQIDSGELIEKSIGDLPLFIFVMMIFETSQFRNNIGQNIQAVTEVIYNTVQEKKPSSCTLTLREFQSFANNINL
jgi:hypothetical protein